MGRFQNFDEVLSVLYVDFDNIFAGLEQYDPSVAKIFAAQPQRWMRWIEGHALRMMYGDGIRRRIIKRMCYMNPHRFSEFKLPFLRSAFQVFDCPAMFGQGKTHAEMLLVIDCLDALNHSTRFDEIIILAGDADYTPLLLRIQEHARRSLVLSVGHPSSSYATACSWRIREDWFISQALEDNRLDEGDSPNDRSGSDVRSEREPKHVENGSSAGEKKSAPAASKNDSAKEKNAAPLPAYKRACLVDMIKEVVAESSVPVPLPAIAQLIQSKYDELGVGWNGSVTVRELVDSLDLSPLVFSHEGLGAVYDPRRHDVVSTMSGNTEFAKQAPALYAFALDVHKVTSLPLLRPAHYDQFVSIIVDEIQSQGFAGDETAQHIRDCCEDEGLCLSLEEIRSVMDGLIAGGLTFGKDNGTISEEMVRKSLIRYATDACRTASVGIDTAKQQQMLNRWLSAGA